jgi:hypothetical protein
LKTQQNQNKDANVPQPVFNKEFQENVHLLNL